MTNTQDEEGLLISELMTARYNVACQKEKITAARFELNALEKRLEEIEQAVIDYCTGNGLKQFKTTMYTITLGESEAVDAPDLEAIPEQFIRTKVVKEPNKILIKELRPSGNWYAIKKNYKITIGSK